MPWLVVHDCKAVQQQVIYLVPHRQSRVCSKSSYNSTDARCIVKSAIVTEVAQTGKVELCLQIDIHSNHLVLPHF
jgi:hypothetical protein